MTRIRGGASAVAVLALAPGLAGACGRRPKTETVTIAAVAFHPGSVTAAVGDTLVFRNDDPVPHTATANGGAFDSGDLQPDGTWRWVPKAPGRIPYHCTYHPNMTGVIVVR